MDTAQSLGACAVPAQRHHEYVIGGMMPRAFFEKDTSAERHQLDASHKQSIQVIIYRYDKVIKTTSFVFIFFSFLRSRTRN